MSNVVKSITILANVVTIVAFILGLLHILNLPSLDISAPVGWKPGRFLLFVYVVFGTLGMIYFLNSLLASNRESYFLACVHAITFPIAYLWLSGLLGVARTEAAPAFALALTFNSLAFAAGYYYRLAAKSQNASFLMFMFSLARQLRFYFFSLFHAALSFGAIYTADPDFSARMIVAPQQYGGATHPAPSTHAELTSTAVFKMSEARTIAG